MPLGDPYWGVCEAGEAGFLPEPETVRERCNFGNARRDCPHFPPAGEFDAISLTAWPERDGAIEIQYIFERDHTPVTHGRLRYCVAPGTLEGSAPEAALRQARAFLDSYLQLKEDVGNRL
jgi:hypothetical protein